MMINVCSSSVNVRNSAASNCDDYLVEFLTPDKPWIRVQLLVLLLTDQWPLSGNIMMTKSELIFRHECIKNDVSFFFFFEQKSITWRNLGKTEMSLQLRYLFQKQFSGNHDHPQTVKRFCWSNFYQITASSVHESYWKRRTRCFVVCFFIYI